MSLVIDAPSWLAIVFIVLWFIATMFKDVVRSAIAKDLIKTTMEELKQANFR